LDSTIKDCQITSTLKYYQLLMFNKMFFVYDSV